MKDAIVTLLFLVAGIMKLLPLIGVLGAKRLSALYRIPFQEPNLLILMQHRAVLFGLLGAFLIYAAFQPGLQPLAFFAGLVSALSFIGLAKAVGSYNPAIAKLVVADVFVTFSLVIGFGLSRFVPAHG